MKKYRFRLKISGNVNRIGFRHLVLKYAHSLGLSGLTGYDGDLIFIEAEGSEEPLNLFIDWCKKGPAGCNIQNFEIIEMEPLHSKEFVICPTHLAVVEKSSFLNL